MSDPRRVVQAPYAVRFVLIAAIIWTSAACDSKRNEYVEPPPPKVTVAQPIQQ